MMSLPFVQATQESRLRRDRQRHEQHLKKRQASSLKSVSSFVRMILLLLLLLVALAHPQEQDQLIELQAKISQLQGLVADQALQLNNLNNNNNEEVCLQQQDNTDTDTELHRVQTLLDQCQARLQQHIEEDEKVDASFETSFVAIQAVEASNCDTQGGLFELHLAVNLGLGLDRGNQIVWPICKDKLNGDLMIFSSVGDLALRIPSNSATLVGASSVKNNIFIAEWDKNSNSVFVHGIERRYTSSSDSEGEIVVEDGGRQWSVFPFVSNCMLPTDSGVGITSVVVGTLPARIIVGDSGGSLHVFDASGSLEMSERIQTGVPITDIRVRTYMVAVILEPKIHFVNIRYLEPMQFSCEGVAGTKFVDVAMDMYRHPIVYATNSNGDFLVYHTRKMIYKKSTGKSKLGCEMIKKFSISGGNNLIVSPMAEYVVLLNRDSENRQLHIYNSTSVLSGDISHVFSDLDSTIEKVLSIHTGRTRVNKVHLLTQEHDGTIYVYKSLLQKSDSNNFKRDSIWKKNPALVLGLFGFGVYTFWNKMKSSKQKLDREAYEKRLKHLNFDQRGGKKKPRREVVHFD